MGSSTRAEPSPSFAGGRRRGDGGTPKRRGSRVHRHGAPGGFENILQKHFAHGVREPGYVRERRAAEVPGEELGVERGGYEHDLEIGSAGQSRGARRGGNPRSSPVVNLVHEDVAHAASVGSAASRRSNTPVVQNKVSSRTSVAPRVESDTPPIDPTLAAFVRDTSRDGDGGDATRLRAHHRRHGRVARGELRLEHELRQLRRLPAPGLAAHHHHLRPRDRVQ